MSIQSVARGWRSGRAGRPASCRDLRAPAASPGLVARFLDAQLVEVVLGDLGVERGLADEVAVDEQVRAVGTARRGGSGSPGRPRTIATRSARSSVAHCSTGAAAAEARPHRCRPGSRPAAIGARLGKGLPSISSEAPRLGADDEERRGGRGRRATPRAPLPAPTARAPLPPKRGAASAGALRRRHGGVDRRGRAPPPSRASTESARRAPSAARASVRPPTLRGRQARGRGWRSGLRCSCS